jgi:NTP pyrophosphatase (non-canonical NTP hydrolase)
MEQNKTINTLIKLAHEKAKNGGWWDAERNIGELLMLIVSELAEGLEALRKDHYADKSVVTDLYNDLAINSHDEEFVLNEEQWKNSFENNVKNTFEDEMADVAIRLFDLCGGLNVDLEKHIDLKMKYNSMRGYKHGKKF